jgi:capsular polysaccharide biosynthesis protein
MSSVLSSYSSLANFAGVDLPGEGTSKSEEAIERLKSFDFFKNHFLPYVKLENLMAVKEWSSESNVVTYNKKIFNNKTNQWIRKVKFPKKQKPSSQEAYEEFSKIFSVSADKETNFVKISLEHESPHIAKEWLDIIVKNINESMRDFDIANAENAIDFLYKRSNDTNILEIKEAISHLLESQMQTLMMASINDDFVFKVIDSPAISEEKIKPSRALICILGTLIGLFFGILVAIMMKFQSKK